jgi:predicted O-linked N-acetylglucosamine transferase (SPINDLY family)
VNLGAAEDISAHFRLGNSHRAQGRYPEAIAAYERALAMAPSEPNILNNLGLALQADGQTERAVASYRAALASKPGHRQALANLAHLLCGLHQYVEALPLCAEFLRRYPDAESTPWVDLGICQNAAGDLDAAEASFRRAVALDPQDAATLCNLASVLAEREDYEGADEALGRIAAGDRSLYALSLLAHCRAHLARWDTLEELHASIAARLAEGTNELVDAFAALSIPLSPAAQLQVAQRWARDLEPSIPLPAVPTRAARTSSRLRVGFVSSDFRDHPVARLAVECWERRDRARIESFAYSLVPSDESALAQRAARAFDHFVDCWAESAETTARRIRADGIEVLIDLNGYTTNERSEVFALKPAPVQASWLGYLGTLGAPWYDYVITDRFVCPPEAQAFFSERFLYLPDCYCPSDSKRAVAARVPSRAECALPEAGLVLACFNHSYKILPQLFAVWMRLLSGLPGSVLWLAPGHAAAKENLAREASARGVDPARLIFAPRLDLPEHLARHAHVDLYLDTTPYNAGTTANDALFMGVPVVTCAGATMASRVAGSQLTAIGLPEFITHSLADYEALVLALGREPQRIAQLKARLSANRRLTPLFDMARFTRAFDDLLIQAWENRT